MFNALTTALTATLATATERLLRALPQLFPVPPS